MHSSTHDDLKSSEKYEVARRSTLVSVFVNLALTTVQIAAGILSASQGLVADGIHSLSDLLADFVVLLANHHGHKAPDQDHQYGHQRYENAASFVLGGMLVVVGIGIFWAAVHKLADPFRIAQVHVLALWVALGALLCKEMLFRYMLAAGERVRSSMLVANAWHARSDAASSLVVAVGIAGNLLGVPILDPIAALIVGCLVAKTGWRFAWDALNDLMDRTADVELVGRIEQALRQTSGILGFHDLRTRKMGDMVLVDVHLEVDADMTVRQGHEIALHARENVMKTLPPVLNVMTHMDPVDPVELNQAVPLPDADELTGPA